MYTGLFFVLPCIENYQKVDLRTITLDVPPQEVKSLCELGDKCWPHYYILLKYRCALLNVKCFLDVFGVKLRA